MRCPDCGEWVRATTEKRGLAALDRHREGRACFTVWGIRNHLFQGLLPCHPHLFAWSQKALDTTMHASSFDAGSKGRRCVARFVMGECRSVAQL